MLDLGRTLLGAVEREPTALAIVDGTIRRKYGDWFEEIRAVAGGLISRGFEPGDRCLILMKNSWQMATIYWACQLACIVATPINWRLKKRDVKFFVEDSMAKGIAFEDSTASVAEAASIGKTHEIKGQAIVAFVTLKENIGPSEELNNELKQHVAQKIGSIARPDEIFFSAELPKTRSGKIMRRLLRDVAEGRALGDTTTLADPAVVKSLQDKYAEEEG